MNAAIVTLKKNLVNKFLYFYSVYFGTKGN